MLFVRGWVYRERERERERERCTHRDSGRETEADRPRYLGVLDQQHNLIVHIYVCVCACVCVAAAPGVCVCKWTHRQRERDRHRGEGTSAFWTEETTCLCSAEPISISAVLFCTCVRASVCVCER